MHDFFFQNAVSLNNFTEKETNYSIGVFIRNDRFLFIITNYWNCPRQRLVCGPQSSSLLPTHGPTQEHQAALKTRVIETPKKSEIKFVGRPSEDPENFLTRLEESRRVTGLSPDDLFSCLHFFLNGVALEWYRISYHK